MSLYKVPSAIKKTLEHKYLPLILAVIAFLIMLPSLGMGLLLDDFVFQKALLTCSKVTEQSDYTESPSQLSLKPNSAMNNCGGISITSDIEELTHCGLLPWWTCKNLKAAFWRPLAGFTHWLDYRFLAGSAELMHAHNLVWFSAAIFFIAVIYRQLAPVHWLAGLSAIMFLLDENNYFPVMWISNRNLILSLLFASCNLFAHHRWRMAGSVAWAIAAPVFLLLSLLSAEVGIAISAYLFAYALLLDRARWSSRLISLFPAGAVIISWRLIYSMLGYGFSSSSLYIDPTREPLEFMLAVPKRLAITLASQMGGLWADLPNYVNEQFGIYILIISVLSLAIIVTILLPLLKRDRLARFWFVGMILSTLPICTTLPLSRNLLFVAIGAFGLMGQFIGSLVSKKNHIPRSLFGQVSAWILCANLIFTHIPMATVGRLLAPGMTNYLTGNFMSTMQVSLQTTDRQVMVVNAPNPLLMFFPFFQAGVEKPSICPVSALAPGFRELEATRTSQNSLLIKASDGNLFTSSEQAQLQICNLLKRLNDFFYDNNFSMHPGQQVKTKIMTIEIIAVDKDNLPTEIQCHFFFSLDEPSLHWLQFDWPQRQYSEFAVPAVGESVKITGPTPFSFGQAVKKVLAYLF